MARPTGLDPSGVSTVVDGSAAMAAATSGSTEVTPASAAVPGSPAPAGGPEAPCQLGLPHVRITDSPPNLPTGQSVKPSRLSAAVTPPLGSFSSPRAPPRTIRVRSTASEEPTRKVRIVTPDDAQRPSSRIPKAPSRWVLSPQKPTPPQAAVGRICTPIYYRGVAYDIEKLRVLGLSLIHI